MGADLHELMHRNHAADNGLIGDFHMPGQIDRIGHDDIIAHIAVVGHMRIGHDKTIPADGRFTALGCPALTMAYSRMTVFSPITSERFLAAEFQILGKRAEDRAVEECDIVAQSRHSGRLTMGADSYIVADDSFGSIILYGPIFDVLTYLAEGSTNRRGMYLVHWSTTIAISSASTTSASPTNPLPCILQVLRRKTFISSSKRS